MKKRDIWLLGGLVLLGVGVYNSRKQSADQQDKIVQRGGKWSFPDRMKAWGFPTYWADEETGTA